MSGASSAGQARTVSGVLVPRGTVSLLLSQACDPAAFYQTRSGLYVFHHFLDRIVVKAEPVPAGTAYQVAISELAEAATDAQIEGSLPKSHLFDESAVCAAIAEMISKQRNGEPGDLCVNNGYANLFYSASWVALVYWYGARREWRVGAWDRDVLRWDADDRVVSPA